MFSHYTAEYCLPVQNKAASRHLPTLIFLLKNISFDQHSFERKIGLLMNGRRNIQGLDQYL